MARSFLKRIEPSRPRSKLIEWPFPVEGEQPKVKVRVLGLSELEAAHLATIDHFKDRKPAVRDDSTVFATRERAELIFLAYSVDGQPLADDVDELSKEPSELLMELHATRMQFQADAAAAPHTPKDMDDLVQLLKKNMDPARLHAFPSTWLIDLITTLVGQLPPSTPANERG